MIKYRNSSKLKISKILWLREIPEHWEVKKFKHYYNSSMGNTILKEDLSDEATIPVYSATEHVVILGYIDNPNVLLHADDFIIPARGNSIGHVKLIEEECTCTQTTIYAKRLYNDRINPDYVYWYQIGLRTKLYEFDNTAIPQITVKQVKENPLLVPSKSEQQAIASYLDRETARIDALIQKKERMIELLKEKRIALITQAVTKGLDPNAPMKDSGIEWLGGIPEHWDNEKPTRLFRLIKGINAAILTKEYISENQGDYPVYSGQTENDGLMGTIDWFDFKFDYPVIFITTVGAKAMTTRIVSGKFSLSQNCALAIPLNSKVNARFYEYAFQRLFDYEKGSISLIMQPSLRFEDFSRFLLPCPNHNEQKTIADYLDSETAKIDHLSESINHSIVLLREYRASLIHNAVTGKIDLREQNAQAQ